jgi:hypothetical protein
MDEEQRRFRLRVTGVEQQQTILPSMVHRFDETYEIEAEHASPAITKLLQEIEWGILDGDEPFEIEVSEITLPEETSG